MQLVPYPDWLEVVVGSNLVGAIPSDLDPAVTGSIGITASTNINPNANSPRCSLPAYLYCQGRACPGHLRFVGQRKESQICLATTDKPPLIQPDSSLPIITGGFGPASHEFPAFR